MADIELVIKIPEEKYRAIINHTEEILDESSFIEPKYLYRAVLDGTPLLKGHGDLIDVDRKITGSTYDVQYEEWGEETLTVREALNRWSDEGVTVKDVVIPADSEKRGENITDKPILEKVDEAMKLGRKQALEEVYEEIRNLFNYRIRIHNRDYDNAKSDQYKYDLSRDAREFNANFNIILDRIKERIEAESEE